MLSDWQDFRQTLKTFTIFALTGFLDALFLATWTAVQWLAKEFVFSKLELAGSDKLFLEVMQILFGFASLAPIAIYIYADIAIMWHRARARIRAETKALRSTSSRVRAKGSEEETKDEGVSLSA